MRKYRKIVVLALAGILIRVPCRSQELLARVTVVSTRIPSTVDKKTFQTLQAALTEFFNNRKWGGDAFQQQEKIECSFLLNLEKVVDADTYQGSLTIQAARPIYGSNYNSPIVNYQDNDVVFKYVQFQSLLFDDNRVQGSEPLSANITAICAYYAYMILGFDAESFALKGGDVYFQKARNIVNNAPDSRSVAGWKAFDGNMNRYWLVENIQNSRYALMHDVYYQYYREGMDQLASNEQKARTGVLNSLNAIDNLFRETPNTMIQQFFFQGKSDELAKLFSKAGAQEKSRALELLQRLDVTNSNKYKQQIK